MSYRFGNQHRPAAYSIIDPDSDGEGLRLFAMFIRNAPQSFPLINPNGSMSAADTRWRQNPLTTLAYTGYRYDTDNSLEVTAKLGYDLHKLLKGLSFDAKYAFDNDWGNFRGMGWRPYVYNYNIAAGTYKQGLANALPQLAFSKDSPVDKHYAEAALRYNRTFASIHKVSGVMLTNYQSKSQYIKNSEYSYVPHIYQALIGRANYEYDNKYLFEINIGYNGSNRFSEGHRYSLFPAASIGWVLTNEKFIPENEILSFAKIRASVGQVGNDDIGTFSYYYNSAYSQVNNAQYSFGTTQNPYITGLIESSLANDMITWETATKYNVGLDSQWFNSNLSFNIDLFRELRSDILVNPEQYIIAAGALGLSPANLGIVENKGIEVELGWNDKITKNFRYYAKGIFAFARNNIIEKSESAQPYDYLYQKGHPIGQFFGYRSMGFFQSYEEIAAAPQQFGLSNLVPGDIRYEDINGDGIIDTNDQTAIGYSTIPEITASATLGIEYKGFDLSFMFQGATRVSINPTADLGFDGNFGVFFEEHLNRWTPEAASTATYPVLKQVGSKGNTNNYYLSTFRLKDGSYLRLKNIQVGYSIPKNWLKNTPLSSVRLYANGFNIFTWAHVNYVDPEMDPKQTNGYFYPQQKVFNAGVNVQF